MVAVRVTLPFDDGSGSWRRLMSIRSSERWAYRVPLRCA